VPTPGTPAWHRQRRANTHAVHAADEAHLRAALATAGWRRRGFLQILVRD
jgi:hypothetical protein